MTTCSTDYESMNIKAKGFKIFKDRHGKQRCYHRATGSAIDLQKFPLGSAEFFSECARIIALQAPECEPKPGTLGLLIKEFRKSQQWKELRPKTREWYEMGFEYLKPIGDMPLINFKASVTKGGAMTDKIINIDDHRPHEARSVECVNCGKKWVAVFPVETKQLECPQCGKMDGVYL